MTFEQNSYLISAAKAAGFSIKLIRDDEIEWKDKEPTAAQLKSIRLETARSVLLAATVAQMSTMGQSLVAKYPQTEQQGWPQKLIEAQAVDKGDLQPDDAFQLSIEAALTGENVADLATATLAAAQLTGMIPAITAGLRRKLETGIAAAKSTNELDALKQGADGLRDAIMAAFLTGDAVQVKAALAAAG